MNELHWTGAAVLLAVAVLRGGCAEPRRYVNVSWADFARWHSLADDEPTAQVSPRAS